MNRPFRSASSQAGPATPVPAHLLPAAGRTPAAPKSTFKSKSKPKQEPWPLPLRIVKAVLGFALLPLRAPLLLLLLLVSVYLGLHWSSLDSPASTMRWTLAFARQIYWSLECFQAVVVVIVCTMPDLLLRQLSALMAASRVMTLVLTLLLVTIAGLYLLRLSVLADVVILAASVLLARLDLTRIRVVPPPLPAAIGLSAYVMLGVWLGRLWHLSALA